MEILRRGLDKLHIDYSERQLEQTDILYNMLVEKNKVMNLTRITDKKEFYVKHVLDSLIVASILKIEDQVIIDVGTGAGFPGLPLKIFYPDISIALLDSVKKKLDFIDEVSEALSLHKVLTIHGRAENIGHEKKCSFVPNKINI